LRKQLRTSKILQDILLERAKNSGMSLSAYLNTTISNGLGELVSLLANTSDESKEWRPYVNVNEEILEELRNKLQVTDKALFLIALFMGLDDNKAQIDFNAIVREVTDDVDSHEEFLSDDFGRDGNITLFFIKRCVQ